MEDQSGTLARELVAQTQRELGETATRSALIASSCACGRGMFPVHGSVLWLGNSTRSCPATGGALPSWRPASRQGSQASSSSAWPRARAWRWASSGAWLTG